MTELIDLALEEDVGSGDLTSQYFIPAELRSKARIFAKEPLVVAGTEAARAVFGRLSAELRMDVIRADGAAAEPGDTILELTGSTRAILTGERLALNFLQRLSGVATLTRTFVRAVEGTGTTILDTRKTTPGLRALEKAAVKAGGGKNHRMGLYDGVMVKDNHLLAHPDLPDILRALREKHPKVLVELEADTIDQVRQFVNWPEVDVILLDNMTPDQLRACVALRRPGIKFEASGGINLDSVRAVAETGVDYVSVGQLTHSARAVDLSLELVA